METITMEPQITEVLSNVGNQFFDFKEAKVQGITLEQLMRTHKENDIYDKPLMGIYHYVLIQNIIDMCKEQGYGVEVYDLFAANNGDRKAPGVSVLPQIEALKGQGAVEAHILRRVFANIRLTDFDDEELTTNLAVSFHQKGIQVGFGPNVKIFHNQCMLNAQYYGSTYSSRGNKTDVKYEIPQLLDLVKSWLVDARHIVVTEKEKIERMKNIDVPAEQLFVIIGMMNVLRVKSDTSIKSIRSNEVYPLNQSQISRFTEKMLVEYDTKQNINLWDVYNAATDLYKANMMDTPNILTQNLALVKTLDNIYHFC